MEHPHQVENPTDQPPVPQPAPAQQDVSTLVLSYQQPGPPPPPPWEPVSEAPQFSQSQHQGASSARPGAVGQVAPATNLGKRSYSVLGQGQIQQHIPSQHPAPPSRLQHVSRGPPQYITSMATRPDGTPVQLLLEPVDPGSAGAPTAGFPDQWSQGAYQEAGSSCMQAPGTEAAPVYQQMMPQQAPQMSLSMGYAPQTLHRQAMQTSSGGPPPMRAGSPSASGVSVRRSGSAGHMAAAGGQNSRAAGMPVASLLLGTAGDMELVPVVSIMSGTSNRTPPMLPPLAHQVVRTPQGHMQLVPVTLAPAPSSVQQPRPPPFLHASGAPMAPAMPAPGTVSHSMLPPRPQSPATELFHAQLSDGRQVLLQRIAHTAPAPSSCQLPAGPAVSQPAPTAPPQAVMYTPAAAPTLAGMSADQTFMAVTEATVPGPPGQPATQLHSQASASVSVSATGAVLVPHGSGGGGREPGAPQQVPASGQLSMGVVPAGAPPQGWAAPGAGAMLGQAGTSSGAPQTLDLQAAVASAPTSTQAATQGGAGAAGTAPCAASAPGAAPAPGTQGQDTATEGPSGPEAP